MRQWRVGTLSMGLLLLGSGIGLLYGQLNSAGIANLAFKWWPLIFIILGVEVLIQYYFRKSEDSKIKYDVFSIFIILIIVLVGVGIQTASEFGLTRYIQSELKSQSYNLTTATTTLDANAKTIIIHAQNAPHLTVRNGSAKSISIYGRGQLRAESRSQAMNLLKDNMQINSHQDGDTLYIDLNADLYPFGYFLTLPSSAAVEIDRGETSLELSPGQINNDWIIKGNGETQILIPSDANLLLSSLDTGMQSLHGNLAWVSKDGKPLATLLSEAMQQENQGDGINNSEQSVNGTLQFQAKLGDGRHKLTIIQAGNLTVNQLP